MRERGREGERERGEGEERRKKNKLDKINKRRVFLHLHDIHVAWKKPNNKGVEDFQPKESVVFNFPINQKTQIIYLSESDPLEFKNPSRNGLTNISTVMFLFLKKSVPYQEHHHWHLSSRVYWMLFTGQEEHYFFSFFLKKVVVGAWKR